RLSGQDHLSRRKRRARRGDRGCFGASPAACAVRQRSPAGRGPRVSAGRSWRGCVRGVRGVRGPAVACRLERGAERPRGGRSPALRLRRLRAAGQLADGGRRARAPRAGARGGPPRALHEKGGSMAKQALTFGFGGYADLDLTFGEFFNNDHTITI